MTNYVGWTARFCGVDAAVIEARAQFCDMCLPGTAENPNNCSADYTIDAESVLEDAGHNAHYCQTHMEEFVKFSVSLGNAWHPPTTEHVILIAFQVKAADRETAEQHLCDHLPKVEGDIECWWVAEDDRHDGSDNDSAVYVKPGCQARAARVLKNYGLGGTNR